VNFSTQTHDFNPGFGTPVNANGERMFWTIEIPDSAVTVNFGAGRAEMHVHDLEIEDYFNFPNASADGEEVDATVSFDVVWNAPISRRYNVTDAANGFAGSFVENQATVNWSASNEDGFTFVANPGSFATSVPEAGPIALLGEERNGTFFPGGSSVQTATNGKGGDALRSAPPQATGEGRSVVFLGAPPPAGETRAPESLPPSRGSGDTSSETRISSDAYFVELAREGNLPWSTAHPGRLLKRLRG